MYRYKYYIYICIHRKVYSELHLPFNLMPILEVFYLSAKRDIKASSSTEHKTKSLGDISVQIIHFTYAFSFKGQNSNDQFFYYFY